jgi:membrane associated rhomboid family serine protease
MPLWLLPVVAIIPLVIVGLFFPLPIGNMAHFGGLLAGLGYGFYLRRRYKKKVQLLGRYFR